ncbi:hypothetical protein [Brevundimonas sp.]|uniref:hypothetical protein n=1 Tax=Brevundimonas sp. TaxID=1871086 RepID=UPI003BAD8190
MDNHFPKAPSLGMWLLAGSACAVTYVTFHPEAETYGLAVFFGCGAAAFVTIVVWLIRCLLAGLGATAREFQAGYREGYDKAEQRKRAAEAGTDPVS